MILTQGQIEMVARTAGLPGDPKVWAAVAMAESSGDTNVVNSIGCVGLWQINQPVWVKEFSHWSVKWLQNPLNNAAAAKIIHKRQGWNAWEAYTGPDGAGSDGPWRQYQNSTGAEPVDLWDDLDDALPDMPDLPDFGIGAIADALRKTADVLVNPRTWLRLAYGITGGVLVVGGLMLIARNTSTGKTAISKVKAAAASTPQGRSVKAVAPAKGAS